MYACPVCGLENGSYDGETFCGKCEGEYHAENERMRRSEIAELNRAIESCGCAGDGGCGSCFRRLARIESLNGNEERAWELLNG